MVYKPIYIYFEEQALKTPNAIALHFKDEAITYDNLNIRANQLARYLIELGVANEQIIAVYMDRDIDFIVSLLAILKCGCAYLPLDKKFPLERITDMIKHSNAALLITDDNLQSFKEINIHKLLLNENRKKISQQEVTNLSLNISDKNLAYVNYTSGTTGHKKGVMITHRGVGRLVINTDYIKLDNTVISLQLSSVGFDAAAFEIWGSLLNGGQCVLSHLTQLSLGGLKVLIESKKINTVFLTTALFNIIIDAEPKMLFNVRQILTGGEKQSLLHFKKAIRILKNSDIVHVYGPTENTTFTTYYKLQISDLERDVIPIGRAIKGSNIYIFKENMIEATTNEVGELYLGGLGLARGYLHEEELTARSFISCFINDNLIRLYKTGDMVKMLSDGTIEFLFRIDNQVKLNGFRMELEEIETVLKMHPDIKNAIASIETLKHGKQLCAFLLGKEGEVPIEKIKKYLTAKLPYFMIPQKFIWLEHIPLTQNGKTDRKFISSLL